MKLPRLITRRRAKWVGTTLTALVLLAYGVSTKINCLLALSLNETSTKWANVGLAEGQVGLILWDMDSVAPGSNLKDARFEVTEFSLDPSFLIKGGNWRGTTAYLIAVPLWFPLLLIAAPPAWLWYTDRRAKPWQCPKCRYDLRGLDGGVCPECGTPIGGGS